MLKEFVPITLMDGTAATLPDRVILVLAMVGVLIEKLGCVPVMSVWPVLLKVGACTPIV